MKSYKYVGSPSSSPFLPPRLVVQFSLPFTCPYGSWVMCSLNLLFEKFAFFLMRYFKTVCRRSQNCIIRAESRMLLVTSLVGKSGLKSV